MHERPKNNLDGDLRVIHSKMNERIPNTSLKSEKLFAWWLITRNKLAEVNNE